MRKDDYLIFEAFQDNLTKTKQALGQNTIKNEEDMSKSPFHYDPMHGLASAAHKIRDELRSAANDEASTEHIEKMAEIILGPQSAYGSVDKYRRVLGGVIELLHHYVMAYDEHEETQQLPAATGGNQPRLS